MLACMVRLAAARARSHTSTIFVKNSRRELAITIIKARQAFRYTRNGPKSAQTAISRILMGGMAGELTSRIVRDRGQQVAVSTKLDMESANLKRIIFYSAKNSRYVRSNSFGLIGERGAGSVRTRRSRPSRGILK